MNCIKECFRALAGASACYQLLFFHGIIECLKDGLAIRLEAIDYISTATAILLRFDCYISHGTSEADGRSKLDPRKLLNTIFNKISVSGINSEDIPQFIIAMRETNFNCSDSVYLNMLRKLELVPAKKLPAAMYQYLLWFRRTSLMNKCFETIFAVLESQNDRAETVDCLSHIRVALLNESNISIPFIKYVKSSFRNIQEVSPFTIVLFLGSSINSEEATRHIESFLSKLASIEECLSNRDQPIPGLEIQRWPSARRIVSRLLNIVENNDEATLIMLINLALKLISHKAGQSSPLVESGGYLLRSIYTVSLQSC